MISEKSELITTSFYDLRVAIIDKIFTKAFNSGHISSGQ
jgi:hypothetical protein